jgi:ABC-type dipeptide/oligopeptide/nickel transport system permease component
VFFIGLILIQYVGFKWGLLPFTGREGAIWEGGLPNMILPALTLGGTLIGPIARLTRTAVLEVLGADFVRTARAKGLRESRVILFHALRNALIPVVTLIGLQAAFLRLARGRTARGGRHHLQRFPGGTGRDHDPVARVPGHQPDRRRPLRMA